MGKLVEYSAVRIGEEEVDLSSVIQPIDGDSTGKNFLHMNQLTREDIDRYIDEAYAAESVLTSRGGINLLPFVVLRSVMRQPSTRTSGTMNYALHKLGGPPESIGGMQASSEAKGESLPDSWIAFATQSDIIATRTEKEWGPALAAQDIDQSFQFGKLARRVPVINLGDGKGQHPTQAMGDLFTIHKHFKGFESLKIAIVGDHERYRAHHSLMLGAAAVGMEIIAVESPVAPIPEAIVDKVGAQLVARHSDLDAAMAEADVLYMGRKPDEYDKKDDEDEEAARREKERSDELTAQYVSWRVGLDRLQQMKPEAIVMHPRPRLDELLPEVDGDPRMKDVEQMANMIPMRMVIIALLAGKSIIEAIAAGA